MMRERERGGKKTNRNGERHRKELSEELFICMEAEDG